MRRYTFALVFMVSICMVKDAWEACHKKKEPDLYQVMAKLSLMYYFQIFIIYVLSPNIGWGEGRGGRKRL